MQIISIMQKFRSIEEALDNMPLLLVSSYDPGFHKTLADLVSLGQHEIDLYDEGEESDIGNSAERSKVLKFVLKCGGSL